MPPEPRLPPAVIVHDAAQARLALAAGGKVTLLSAPGAGAFAGVLWWQGLISASGASPPHILDCGDAAGHALAALRAGQRLIVLGCPSAIFDEVAARAAGLGARLLPAAPPALDLARPGATRQLARWVTQPVAPRQGQPSPW